MASKHRRDLDRLKQKRENLTTPYSREGDERRPLAGLEDYYEITRRGDVWSRRLGRFIRQKMEPLSGATYIEVRVAGEIRRLSVWKAVVDSWMTAEERRAIRARMPAEHRTSYSKLKAHVSEVEALAAEVNLPARMLFGLLLAKDEDV